MRIVMFYQSLMSDWNHGNAHFLRGVATELKARGHEVVVFEPRDSWSASNLEAEHGRSALMGYLRVYPGLVSTRFDLANLDLTEALDGADVVLVHEWNDHELVRRFGEHRAANPDHVLLFHDTHHRSVTNPESMAAYELDHYDGVLAFGRAVRDVYLERGWAAHAWTWHEAADVRVFRRIGSTDYKGDLVWIGNWADEERASELREFLVEPVSELRLRAEVHGVRYPDQARAELRSAGIDYRGWLPNYEAPRVFARHRVTVHIPRRPYAKALPGIPTIRVFEALACGIPLVSAPWNDEENLFTPGADFLMARNGDEMKKELRVLLNDRELAGCIANHGMKTVLSRHTCAHRVDELLTIVSELRRGRSAGNAAA